MLRIYLIYVNYWSVCKFKFKKNILYIYCNSNYMFNEDVTLK